MLQESCSVAPTDSHHCRRYNYRTCVLASSGSSKRPAPTACIGLYHSQNLASHMVLRHFQLNASAENCSQVVFRTLMFTAVSLQGLGVEWKMWSS